ncbi:MAG: tyrosine-type recombinase/integrase [Microbacteriaceae bacterium]
MRVERVGGSHRIVGGPPVDGEVANAYLSHLEARSFAALTVRAYAFHVLSFLRFCADRELGLAVVSPMDVFDFLDWLARPKHSSGNVVALRSGRGAAPSTVNQRVAAVRGLFEFAVISGVRDDCPVPTARRSSGARAKRRGLLSHVSTGRPRTGGRLVRQPQRLPESLDAGDVNEFFADLLTYRDRAIVLAMLLGGLRAGEVRSLRLGDVDVGVRQVRVVGKGGRERVVPIHRGFFVELTNYLRHERSSGISTPECFVVLRGPTTGQAMTEAGMRKIFRAHRERSGALRVRPHRLRHTYGTDLAAAGMDLLVLRELMGHASPETTAGYVHVSPARIAAEYAKAQQR